MTFICGSRHLDCIGAFTIRMTTSFEEFRSRFHWKTEGDVFSVNQSKCLENVFLSLYWHGHVSVQHFGLMHDPALNLRFWDALRGVRQVADIPETGDIAVRDFMHAMIFMQPICSWYDDTFDGYWSE